MSDTTRAQLKALLLSRYRDFRRKLERVVGSSDSAQDALNETWIRLDSAGELGPVANGDAYLMRMATNVAIEQHRTERRHLHERDIDEMFDVPDELADPERIVAARMEIDVLKEVLHALPSRQRQVLLAARVEGRLNREIAVELGISLRLVEKELSLALKAVNRRMLDMMHEREVEVGGRRKF
ncbi:RNA polymerase sigma factor [Burkholderia sp. Ac-20353]|uniref:RNA polymerase sigma factor n=1 Tax=Burkholderia sp. Ac-20353 TaxID=2703894 RepID=UPI00197C4552|nr:RNA polymerase sigma factor [Burkholderia sp. Ac-20353]MBN3790716.1 RNA polymerase sigma factor [Burkholderia sp. Ac-20353]